MKATAKFIVLHASVHKTTGGAIVPAHRAWLAVFALAFIFTFAFILITTRDATAKATASAFAAYSELPQPISAALIHYASTNGTNCGRMSSTEMKAVATILRHCDAPCSFLFFGLTHDSRTVFVDESSYLVSKLEEKHRFVEAYDVQFTAKVGELYNLIEHYKREIPTEILFIS